VRQRGGAASSWPPKPATAEEVSTDYFSENSADSNSKPAIAAEVSTDLVVGRSPTASACEPYRELIGDALARGRNARAIWQDLVDDHGFVARYASVLRFVRRLRGAPVPEARVVITTAPGEECQVDYGEGPMVRDKATGKYRRTRLFVLTLGYSRKSVRLIVPKSSSRIWAELHERAFRESLADRPRLRRHVARLHGGGIVVRSVPNVGSTFILYFPAI